MRSRIVINVCLSGLLTLTSSLSLAHIKFSKKIPNEQKKLMEYDLKNLSDLSFTDADQSGERLFKTPMTKDNLKKWLFDRSQYIVSEDYDMSKNMKPLQQTYKYPNDIMPDFEKSTAAPVTGNITVVMSNIGAAAYLGGKKAQALIGLDIPGHDVIPVKSPRVGIFKVGAGLFMPLLRNSDNYKTFGHSLKRLTTFFHEARHSDGNAKSLAFVHAVCPVDHMYGGYNACDRNTNGPYSIGATFLKASVENCSKCSESEKEALRVQYTDSFSRILTVARADETSEDAIRAAQDTLRETCENLANLKIDLSQFDACKNIDQANSNSATDLEMPKVGDLDETPERGED